MIDASVSISTEKASVRIEALGQTRADGYVVFSGLSELYRGTAAELKFTDGVYTVLFIFDEGSNDRPGSSGSYALIYGGT